MAGRHLVAVGSNSLHSRTGRVQRKMWPSPSVRGTLRCSTEKVSILAVYPQHLVWHLGILFQKFQEKSGHAAVASSLSAVTIFRPTRYAANEESLGIPKSYLPSGVIASPLLASGALARTSFNCPLSAA